MEFGRSSGHGLWRSRWAAIGAAVAVALGGGGLLVASAADGVPSSFVAVTPARVVDTRVDLGLDGPLVSAQPAVVQITGSVPTTAGSSVVVPAGATAVVANVTAVGPTAAGFVSVRPVDATGVPSTSSLNFSAGQIVANSLTVQLPVTGNFQVYYAASSGATVHSAGRCGRLLRRRWCAGRPGPGRSARPRRPTGRHRRNRCRRSSGSRRFWCCCGVLCAHARRQRGHRRRRSRRRLSSGWSEHRPVDHCEDYGQHVRPGGDRCLPGFIPGASDRGRPIDPDPRRR